MAKMLNLDDTSDDVNNIINGDNVSNKNHDNSADDTNTDNTDNNDISVINDNKSSEEKEGKQNADSKEEDKTQKLFTQEELEQVLKTRLTREKEKLATFETELNAKNELIKSHEEKIEKQEQEIFEGIKYKVAQETGLSVDIISALAGDSYDVVLANAQKIATVQTKEKENKEFKIPSKDESKDKKKNTDKFMEDVYKYI